MLMNRRRAIVGWVLSIIMVISLFNVPLGVLDVQAEEGMYSVTFLDENGELVSEVDINIGDSLMNISKPSYSKEGFIHDGYVIDGGDGTVYYKNIESADTLWINTYVPEGDVVFKPHFVKEYTVTFDANGGNIWYFNVESADYNVGENHKIGGWCSKYEAKCDNKAFLGYKTDGDDTLYILSEYQTLKDGEKRLKDYVVTKDVTFVAQWADLCTVTYEPNGGQLYEYKNNGEPVLVSELKKTYVKGEMIANTYPLTGLKRDGYYLVGFLVKGTDKVYEIDAPRASEGAEHINDYVVNGDVTFEAVWEKTYDVIYDVNGGTFQFIGSTYSVYQLTTFYGASVRSFWPTRDGYIFAGWKIADETELNGTVVEDLDSYIIQGDVTFTAQWSEAYTVTYELDGGYYHNGPYTVEDVPMTEKYSAVEQTIQLKGVGQPDRPYKDGYTLVGWIKKGDSTIYEPSRYENGQRVGGYYNLTGDITFTAVWKRDCAILGHSWDKGVVTQEATCTETGEKTFTCEACGETKTEAINAKGHTVVRDSAVAATATSTGLTEGSHCSACGTIITKQETVPRLIDKQEETKQEDVKREENKQQEDKQDNDSESIEGTAESINEEPKLDKTEHKNEWVDGKWYNADGSQTYEGTISWASNSTGWWIEDTAGWYPVSCWQKIDGYWYYFDASGYMASSCWQDGCWLGSSGAWTYEPTGSWKGNSSGWWFEDTSGWYAYGQWLKINGSWYYFDASGYMVTNTRIDGYWIGADGVCQ